MNKQVKKIDTSTFENWLNDESDLKLLADLTKEELEDMGLSYTPWEDLNALPDELDLDY